MNKPILAIETSGNICSLAIYFDEKKYFLSDTANKNSHSKIILSGIDFLMKTAGINFAELDSIAVSIGPGSFTGLRIGLSVAKGIAFGHSLPIIPVPTFEAIALESLKYIKDDKPVVIAIKVNNDEVYFNSFKINQNSFIFESEIKLIKIIELKNFLKDFVIISNIEIEGSFYLESLSHPSALYVGKWARDFGEKEKTLDYDLLEPKYIKEFQIKR